MIKHTSTSQPHSNSQRHERPFRRRSGTCVVAVCGLFAALGSGCKQEPLCKELGNCGGGVPIGNWALSPGHGSCSEDLYIPPTDTRLVQGDLPAARTSPSDPALFDWCLLLVTRPGASGGDAGGMDILANPPRFFFSDGRIGAATVRYDPDGHFSVSITISGTYTLDFPAFCMRAFGAMDGKPADPANNPDGGPVNICKQLEVPVRAVGNEGSYFNTTCDPNPDDPGGCLCLFDVTETGGSAGTYQVLNANTILHLPSTNFPQKVTFCNKGDSLQLTGTDGAYLFDVQGLRTMDLAKVPQPCSAGFGGQNGMCLPCINGETACDGLCVNEQTDLSNCGGCAVSCATGATCQAGVCTCPSVTVVCGSACVNEQTDPSNCGGCGAACLLGGLAICQRGQCFCQSWASACNGLCVDEQTNPSNCGACNNICPGSAPFCRSGVCAAN